MEETSKEKKSSKKILMPIIGVVILLAAAYFAYTKIAYARHIEDTLKIPEIGRASCRERV